MDKERRMDNNNNDDSKNKPKDDSSVPDKPVRIRKIRKCIVDAAPHIRLKRRDEAMASSSSSKSRQKSEVKRKCKKCPARFDVTDVEGIYLHWEGEHRRYPEEVNPYPPN